MPRPEKQDERTEQVPRGNRKIAQIELLRPQAKGETVNVPSEQIKELFGDILQRLSDLIWETDENGVFTWCSGAAEDIFGVSTRELIGKRLFDFMPAEESQRMKNLFEEIFLRKQPIKDIEACPEDRHGKRHWLYVNGVPIIDNKGLLKGYLGIYRDIATPKKAEESLRESEVKFRTLADEAFDGIAIHEGQRIIEINKAFGILWGYDSREAAGMKIDELFAPECRKDVKEKVQSDYNRPYEAVAVRKDGTKFRLEIAGKFITYKGQKVRIATVRDITERKRAEENLRNSEERYRVTFENTGTATVLIEEDTTIILANTEFERLSGFSKQEIEGKKKWTEFVAKEDLPWMLEQHRLRRKNREDAAKQYEFRFVTRNGNIRNIAHLTDVIPGTKRSVAALMDITERKLTEEKLQNERNLLRTLIDHIPDGIYVKDKDGRFILYNKSVAEYWCTKGVTDLLGKTDFDILPQTTAQSYFDEERKIMSTNRPLIDREGTCADSTGNLHHFLTTKVPLRDTHGNIVGTAGVNHEITTIKLFESKLLDYQKQLKRLASRLITVEEQERRHIAGAIHDEISQTLAMAKIKLDKLRNSPLPETTVQAIEEVTSCVEQVIQETRTLTFELSNPTLYELGFEVAVAEWLNENIQEKHGIATEFHDDGLPKPLDDDLKAMLFRNAHELLINCIKHAKAKKIRVSILRIDDSIEVAVEDNGVGFDPAQVWTKTGKKATYGLFSIRENMENTGGSFKIESKPGAGCKAIMTAPLKSQSNKKEV